MKKKEAKKDVKKGLVKDSMIFLKKKKTSENIVPNNIKIFLNLNNKGLLSIEKNIKCEKRKPLNK